MIKTEKAGKARPPAESVPSGFIYENEHPQLQIPFTAQVGDRRMEGKSISITQALVSGLLPPTGNWEKCPVVLRFDFEGFSVNLFVEADVEKIGASDSSAIRLRFCEPSASHLAPLRYILNSHLAGDLVTFGRMLGYSGPTKVEATGPALRAGPMQRASTGLRKLALVGLSLGLIAIAATVMHDRIVFAYEPRPVTITQSGTTLRATAAGQITYADNQAATGDVVYSIGTNSGDLLSVRMPCDCTILPLEGFTEGATVLAGAPLIKLVAAGAALEADTQISFDGVARLLSGDAAELEFGDGRVVPVTVQLSQQGDSSANTAVVAARVRLAEPDAADVAIGETGRLRFRRPILAAGTSRTTAAAAVPVVD